VPDYSKPFIDTDYFDFTYGTNDERVIDLQYLCTDTYSDKVLGKDKAVFGVNFADRQIKGYSLINSHTKENNSFTVRLVQRNTEYGKNTFIDNQN
jgi:hypothetical protein